MKRNSDFPIDPSIEVLWPVLVHNQERIHITISREALPHILRASMGLLPEPVMPAVKSL